MSMHPQPIAPVPQDTDRVARAAFPMGNMFMKMREELGTIYQDKQFAQLFPTQGEPAEACTMRKVYPRSQRPLCRLTIIVMNDAAKHVTAFDRPVSATSIDWC